MSNTAGNLGALLIGSFIASALSGIVTVQAIVYFKLYPQDRRLLKALALSVWILDIAHSCCVWSALWDYLIRDFGEVNREDIIPVGTSLSIIFTATVTLLAQLFFIYRIYRLSHKNWLISLPILIMTVLRMVAAAGTGAEMMALQDFITFRRKYRWLFSSGLGMSSAADIFITFSLFFLLQQSRSKSMSLNDIIDSLILYTFEIGTLTGAATVACMVCWLTMEKNLVFLAVHFTICKLYANSLFATLNTRMDLAGQQKGNGSALMDLGSAHQHQLKDVQLYDARVTSASYLTGGVAVNVEKTVQYDNLSV
jgi:hypothetical protein